MEKTENIKMPEPLHLKKINTKLDFFSETPVIRQWPGYSVVDTLFYLYLFNKYKHNCLIKDGGGSLLGVRLKINKKLSFAELSDYKEHLGSISTQLSKCIKKNLNSIVIPLYLEFSTTNHANLLIYRKKDNIIEHFEPHGSVFMGDIIEDKRSIVTQLKSFIDMLNSNLIKKKKKPVTLISSDVVCPYIYGLQGLEASSKQVKYPLQGKGYCAAWSMFFTELVLKNPTVPTNELLNIIINKFDKNIEKQRNYLRQIIVGYVNLIHNKIEKYFQFITGTKDTLDNIIEMMNKGQYDFGVNYNTTLTIQTVLLNNPSLTKKKYLKNLENQKLTNPENKLEIDRYINVLKQMDLISPSPLSLNSSSSSKTKKASKKGKKTRKLITKKVINCGENSKLNDDTRRCNKIKVYPVCPSTRNPITNRCKTIKQ
jgi:hypothetical protein